MGRRVLQALPGERVAFGVANAFELKGNQMSECSECGSPTGHNLGCRVLAQELVAEVALLKGRLKQASSIITDTFPAHRIIVDGHVGQPDDKNTTWTIDLGLVRRAHSFLTTGTGRK